MTARYRECIVSEDLLGADHEGEVIPVLLPPLD